MGFSCEIHDTCFSQDVSLLHKCNWKETTLTLGHRNKMTRGERRVMATHDEEGMTSIQLNLLFLCSSESHSTMLEMVASKLDFGSSTALFLTFIFIAAKKNTSKRQL
jgi:hypothetical protein